MSFLEATKQENTHEAATNKNAHNKDTKFNIKLQFNSYNS
jgi:hypothetical protein